MGDGFGLGRHAEGSPKGGCVSGWWVIGGERGVKRGEGGGEMVGEGKKGDEKGTDISRSAYSVRDSSGGVWWGDMHLYFIKVEDLGWKMVRRR